MAEKGYFSRTKYISWCDERFDCRPGRCFRKRPKTVMPFTFRPAPGKGGQELFALP